MLKKKKTTVHAMSYLIEEDLILSPSNTVDIFFFLMTNTVDIFSSQKKKYIRLRTWKAAKAQTHAR